LYNFKVRPGIKKQYDSLHNFGIENLIVSGCSFTYNHYETSACTWPYYLRDLGEFAQVFDCSLPGAGNHHISTALIWSLENQNIDPKTSLVVVMWSGCDRDDYLCPQSNNSNTYPYEFFYSKTVVSGITGGSRPESVGNTNTGLKELGLTKTPESRAIENYLHVCTTWHYLHNRGYRCVFLQFLDDKLPSRTQHFDIRPYLSVPAKKNFDAIMTKIVDPYTWALRQDLLSKDDFHPSPAGHLSWTRQVLLPKLQQLLG
jgi:hypothetical protein